MHKPLFFLVLKLTDKASIKEWEVIKEQLLSVQLPAAAGVFLRGAAVRTHLWSTEPRVGHLLMQL